MTNRYDLGVFVDASHILLSDRSTHGAERMLTRIETAAAQGFLAGDIRCRTIVANCGVAAQRALAEEYQLHAGFRVLHCSPKHAPVFSTLAAEILEAVSVHNELRIIAIVSEIAPLRPIVDSLHRQGRAVLSVSASGTGVEAAGVSDLTLDLPMDLNILRSAVVNAMKRLANEGARQVSPQQLQGALIDILPGFTPFRWGFRSMDRLTQALGKSLLTRGKEGFLLLTPGAEKFIIDRADHEIAAPEDVSHPDPPQHSVGGALPLRSLPIVSRAETVTRHVYREAINEVISNGDVRKFLDSAAGDGFPLQQVPLLLKAVAPHVSYKSAGFPNLLMSLRYSLRGSEYCLVQNDGPANTALVRRSTISQPPLDDLDESGLSTVAVVKQVLAVGKPSLRFGSPEAVRRAGEFLSERRPIGTVDQFVSDYNDLGRPNGNEIRLAFGLYLAAGVLTRTQEMSGDEFLLEVRPELATVDDMLNAIGSEVITSLENLGWPFSEDLVPILTDPEFVK